jgi:hypothetical protein
MLSNMTTTLVRGRPRPMVPASGTLNPGAGPATAVQAAGSRVQLDAIILGGRPPGDLHDRQERPQVAVCDVPRTSVDRSGGRPGRPLRRATAPIRSRVQADGAAAWRSAVRGPGSGVRVPGFRVRVPPERILKPAIEFEETAYGCHVDFSPQRFDRAISTVGIRQIRPMKWANPLHESGSPAIMREKGERNRKEQASA